MLAFSQKKTYFATKLHEALMSKSIQMLKTLGMHELIIC